MRLAILGLMLMLGTRAAAQEHAAMAVDAQVSALLAAQTQAKSDLASAKDATAKHEAESRLEIASMRILKWKNEHHVGQHWKLSEDKKFFVDPQEK